MKKLALAIAVLTLIPTLASANCGMCHGGWGGYRQPAYMGAYQYTGGYGYGGWGYRRGYAAGETVCCQRACNPCGNPCGGYGGWGGGFGFGWGW